MMLVAVVITFDAVPCKVRYMSANVAKPTAKRPDGVIFQG
jgi:hypothetical protein